MVRHRTGKKLCRYISRSYCIFILIPHGMEYINCILYLRILQTGRISLTRNNLVTIFYHRCRYISLKGFDLDVVPEEVIAVRRSFYA